MHTIVQNKCPRLETLYSCKEIILPDIVKSARSLLPSSPATTSSSQDTWSGASMSLRSFRLKHSSIASRWNVASWMCPSLHMANPFLIRASYASTCSHAPLRKPMTSPLSWTAIVWSLTLLGSTPVLICLAISATWN